MINKKIFAVALCLIVTTIFSFHYLAAKQILTDGVSQYALSAWRGLLGGGIILLIFRQKFCLTQIKENILSLGIISFLGFFINQIFFMKGLSLTSSFNAAVITNTIPIVTAILAFTVKLEKLTLRKSVGILISFGFVCYLIFGRQSLEESHILFNLGNSFILLNVIAFCIAMVLGKKLLTKDFPYVVLTGVMLFGGGLMMSLVAGSSMFELTSYAVKAPLNLSIVLFEIIVSTSIAYLLNLKALSMMSATKVSFFIYLQPIITGLSGYFIYGTQVPLHSYLVFAGILMGGYLVIMQKGD